MKTDPKYCVHFEIRGNKVKLTWKGMYNTQFSQSTKK